MQAVTAASNHWCTSSNVATTDQVQMLSKPLLRTAVVTTTVLDQQMLWHQQTSLLTSSEVSQTTAELTAAVSQTTVMIKPLLASTTVNHNHCYDQQWPNRCLRSTVVVLSQHLLGPNICYLNRGLQTSVPRSTDVVTSADATADIISGYNHWTDITDVWPSPTSLNPHLTWTPFEQTLKI